MSDEKIEVKQLPVKDEIVKYLDILIQNYKKNLADTINSEAFITSTQPALNLLTLPALSSLAELLNRPEISDRIAINKIENLIQSVQYNHKQKTPVEDAFFKIFTLGKIESWKRRANGNPVSGITVCFGGTGHINHLEGEAHCEIANNYNSSLENKVALDSYVYNVTGVASDPEGLYDPDILGVHGKITGREPKYPYFQPVALVKGQKSIAGNGCVEAVKDAFEFIKQRIEGGDIADGAVITILGHSRGAVESLLLTQLLMNHPDLIGNRTLKVVAHDPVRGKLIPPGLFTIGEETFDVDALLSKPKPENAPLAQITIPIAMSDLRHDEFPLIDIHKFEVCMGEGVVSVEPHPGFHNCALMPSANVNAMVISNKFEENPFSNLWYRRNFAGDSLEREAKMDALNSDYKFLLNNYYLLDDKNQLAEENKGKCIEIYSRWILENYESKLINPGFHAAVTEQPRYIDKHYLSKIPGLFYNQHHEALVKTIAPEFFMAVEALFQNELIDAENLTPLLDNLSEEGLAQFQKLPIVFQNLASTITVKNILDNKKIQEDTSNEKNKESTSESIGAAFVRDMVLYPEEHAKKTAKTSYQRFARIDESINAATTLAKMKKALTDIKSHPKLGIDDKFNLAIKAAAKEFLHHCDDSHHKDPNVRLQYFLMKEYCQYLDNKLTNTKMRQAYSNAISRLRNNINLVTSALINITSMDDPNKQIKYITNKVIPNLETGSEFNISSLAIALEEGIENHHKSAPSLEAKQTIANLDLLIANSPISLSRFSLDENNKLTKNWILATKDTQALTNYLKAICTKVFKLDNEELKTPLNMSLRISLQNFLHLQTPDMINELGLDLDFLKSSKLNLERLGHYNKKNRFHADLLDNKLPKINYNVRTGHYTSPDDDKAHQHGAEAARIFFSTQIERLKGLINWMFAKIGIHVLETARYSEHDYLDSDIYAHDSAIDPDTNKASHYWIGHASNFLVIPTPNGKPLHVLTDPFEGDMAPVIYPRMTKEGKLIDGEGDKRLPKVDVVIMSHNHRDHHSEETLQRLLKQNPKMIVPQGDKKLFTHMGFTDVVELEAWEEATIKDGDLELLRITSVPARHWSGRGLTDAHKSAFNGYVLQSKAMEGDIYFAGDTAFMDDINVNPLFAKFDIKTSIQPGGPDERREDMESTHQSSADGIWMHFKMLASHYEKMKAANQGMNPSLQDFLEKIKQVKTIYNHTATFKLGNLRLKDTFFSYQRVLGAFKEYKEHDKWQNIHLPTHEKNAYKGILALAEGMVFGENNHSLTKDNIVELIQRSVIIPKIGQRQALYSTQEEGQFQSFQHRSLITNRRSLIEFDTVMKEHINSRTNADIAPSEIILKLLDAYHNPWHAFYSRTYKKDHLERYRKMISDCENDPSILLDALNQMEQDLGENRNLHGHMQSLIHYAKWVVNFVENHPENALDKFKEYFDCQQVRKLVDQELQNSNKQRDVFVTLSDQLAKTPQNKDSYKNIFDAWLKARPIANDNQTNEQMLFERSSDKEYRTHNKEVVKNIKNIVNTNHFFPNVEKEPVKEIVQDQVAELII